MLSFKANRYRLPSFIIVVSILIFSLIISNSCIQQPLAPLAPVSTEPINQTEPNITENYSDYSQYLTGPRDFNYIEVFFPHGAPKLNDTADLKCVLNCSDIWDNLTVKLVLPEGFVQVGGDLPWAGNMPEEGSIGVKTTNATSGGSRMFTAFVKAVKVGDWTLGAVAISGVYGGNIAGGAIYTLISETSAIWSKEPFSEHRPWLGFQIERPTADKKNKGLNTPQFTISRATALNQTGELKLVISAPPDAEPVTLKNIIVRLNLPEGFSLINGSPDWSGDIIAGGNITMNWTVKAVKTGDWNIEAIVEDSSPSSYIIVNGNQYPITSKRGNHIYNIWIQVGENSAILGGPITKPAPPAPNVK